MDVSVKLYDLNKFLGAANTGIKLRGLGENTFELTYNPGALLPDVTMKLRKCGFDKNYVPFRYEVAGASSLMLSAANIFSFLPEGVVIDKAAKTISIVQTKLKLLSSFGGRCYFKYFNIHFDSLEIGLYIV